jgi:hypothetical protein
MPRTIEFEGRSISVPDDFSDAEIAEVLAAGAPAAPSPPQAPQPQAPAESTGAMRGLKIGLQGAGRGLAEVAGAPVDLTTAALNAGITGVNLASRVIGYDTNLPTIQRPFGGSQQIADVASSAAQAAGYEPVTPTGLRESVAYNTNRFGANAAGTVGALFGAPALAARVAGRAPAPTATPSAVETLRAPYREAPVQTLIGDVGASAGAGATTGAIDTVIPESIRNDPVYGPMLALPATLVGATGGGVAAQLGAAGAQKAARAATDWAAGNSIQYVDPATGMPFNPRDLDTAATVVQGQASDPRLAAENIAAYRQRLGELTVPPSDASTPTAGLVSGDTGLIAAENRARTRDGVRFTDQDRRVNAAALDEAERLAPAANPELVAAEAQRVAAERMAAEEAAVARAQRGVDRLAATRAGQGEELRQWGALEDSARQRLDQAVVEQSLQPMTAEKTRQFQQVPDGPMFSRPVVDAADEIVRNAERLPPGAQADIVPQARVDDILQNYVSRREDGTRVGRGYRNIDYNTVNQLRALLSSDVAQARKALASPPYIENLERLRSALSQMTETMPAAAAANQHFRDVYAAVWGRQNPTAYEFRQRYNQDPLNRSRTPPDATASTFVRPNDRQAAEELGRIFQSTPDPAAAQAAARDYLMADLARRGGAVNSRGMLNPAALRRWADDNRFNLDLVPGLRDEVQGLLGRAQRGEAMAGQFTENLRNAQRTQRMTEDDINRSVLGRVIGADPTNVVSTILQGRNPVADTRRLLRDIGGNADAREGLKAAVRDYLMERGTTSAVQNTPDGRNPVSFAKLDALFKQHEDVLAQVYSPAEMNRLRAMHELLRPLTAKGLQATAGSPTAERVSAVGQLIEAGLKIKYGMLKGGGLTRIFKQVVNAMPSDGEQVNRLLAEFWFNPKLAQHMLTRDVRAVGSQWWNGKLFRLLGLEEAIRADDEGRGDGRDR